ncbi:SUZ domain-containing protein 1 [Orchesella cincta]|uniref:SUZ domain-containing protein 1 n=1 Tax=Orchesella cincta TaxID=48709 RepID=A0A1D2NKK5_ORCCI|nr:SUZ domain-containing protein 1 [Orchesella cincta]
MYFLLKSRQQQFLDESAAQEQRAENNNHHHRPPVRFAITPKYQQEDELLEQQLEKLQLNKERQQPSQQSETLEPSLVLEGPPKMKVLKRIVPNNNPEDRNGVRVTSASTNGVIDLSQEESMRTQYVAPEPRISILSRPKKKTPGDDVSNSMKGKNQPVKTLEQREQEYAEARRRIFGAEGEGDPVETQT